MSIRTGSEIDEEAMEEYRQPMLYLIAAMQPLFDMLRQVGESLPAAVRRLLGIQSGSVEEMTFPPEMRTIPTLSSGGIVTNPAMAIPGEYHRYYDENDNLIFEGFPIQNSSTKLYSSLFKQFIDIIKNPNEDDRIFLLVELAKHRLSNPAIKTKSGEDIKL